MMELAPVVSQWIATALTLVGTLYLIYRSKWNFILFIISNVFWMYWSWSVEGWGLFVCEIVFMILNAIGFIRWYRIERKPA